MNLRHAPLLASLTFVSAFAGAGPSLLPLLTDLVKKPTAEKLAAFKLACTRGAQTTTSIDFDGSPEANRLLTEIQGHGDFLSVRAAVHAAGHCSDGASAERIQSWLGNELLLRHPRTLVRALDAEGAVERFANVVELEDNTWFAVDCQGEARCLRDRKAAFAKKRKALEFAKPTKSEAAARQKLLEKLRSDL